MKNRENYLLIGEAIFFVFLICGVYIHYQKKIEAKKENLEILKRKVDLINQLEETDKIWQEKAKIYLAEDLVSLKKGIRDKANLRNIRLKSGRFYPLKKRICFLNIK